MQDLSHPIEASASGDRYAADKLLPLDYDELRQLAAVTLTQEKPGHTRDATSLVHESYVRLSGDQHFENRRHFFAAAAEATRRILVENARRKLTVRHGGGRRRG
jgi:RNA polymerase sigma factor (TIGR02999 family)